MQHRLLGMHLFLLALFASCLLAIASPAYAAADAYVTRYLHVVEPVPLVLDEQGHTRLFAAEEMSTGKQLFERNCLNCHVGGATLPDPSVSLSLKDLQSATPRRDTISSLVAYLRQPMTYSGTEETFWCRQVPETWLSQAQVEKLAGFVLRAAQTAPGWGGALFPDK
ncbi:photosystem II cytochrome PsbV2 [Stenomitos frigidus]|uniref:Photosystem II cytochrome PsbV2 n=1 Tax=Stenomitos frigidus ULC18 TaxID=2107698 RepID=A0A2T1E6E2_9CYAN|nr:photosystem II cytochrome PsbV2 [Stenomitos frigidus]PSB28298.1 photosystem II cytochrome PsbV2 [Stenomitos frigidus ULC18]